MTAYIRQLMDGGHSLLDIVTLLERIIRSAGEPVNNTNLVAVIDALKEKREDLTKGAIVEMLRAVDAGDAGDAGAGAVAEATLVAALLLNVDTDANEPKLW